MSFCISTMSFTFQKVCVKTSFVLITIIRSQIISTSQKRWNWCVANIIDRIKTLSKCLKCDSKSRNIAKHASSANETKHHDISHTTSFFFFFFQNLNELIFLWILLKDLWMTIIHCSEISLSCKIHADESTRSVRVSRR